MSGPVTTRDVEPEPVDDAAPGPASIEVVDSRRAEIGAFTVHRALPQRRRRTIGAWCFMDHMGPTSVTEEHGLDIGPHPHIGLQTVTWLFEGEVLHRDSVGSEQLIRPGQLNLMTAGHGVSHAEEATGTYRGRLHGVQLWIAQPDATRHGQPAFEHHAALPEVDLGPARATVLVGEALGATSPARRDTDHVGIDLRLRAGRIELPLDRGHEHGVAVFEGTIGLDGQAVATDQLAHLPPGRDRCVIETSADARVLVVGGAPFPDRVTMWWNYVARSRDEISEAHRDWSAGSDRFGHVASPLARIDTGPPPWT